MKTAKQNILSGTRWLWAMVGAAFVAAGAPPAFAEPQVTAEITRMGDASHVEFKGPSSWKYDLRRESGKGGDRVLLRVPKLQSDAIVKLKSYSDAMIRAVEISENGIDDSDEIVFQLKSDKVDAFDYQTEQPATLIVDFFLKDQPKPNEPKEAAPKAGATDPAKPLEANALPKELPEKGAPKAAASPDAKAKKAPKRKTASNDGDIVDEEGEIGLDLPAADLANVQTLPQAKLEDPKRKIAGTDFIQVDGKGPAGETEDPAAAKAFRHGIFDGGDPYFKRFSIEDYEIKEDALIASRGNIFIKFPPVVLDAPHLKTLWANPPIYEIEEKDSAETKEAQLLLTLFNNKRRAVFLKTAKFFLEKYPKTQYDEIVKYMMADVYYDLWLSDKNPNDFETAMGLYRSLTEKYPDSPLTTRTLLLMGYSFLYRGDSFGALKTFQRFVRIRPESKFTDQVKITMAGAYLKLNKFDDAYQLYDEVEKKAANKKDMVEAAYRKGDIFFQKRDLAGAIREYKEALKKYPEHWAGFPNAYYNVAEAEFWQGQYKEALRAYRDFLVRFPDHTHGGYAMTRLGELLEILGADSKRVMGAYLESYFRYRATPGAAVARIRVLGGRMPEMKDKELKSALKEIEETTEQSDLPDMKEFTRLMIADGYYARKEYEKALEELVNFYQRNPNASNQDKFKSRIVRSITENIRSNVDKGNFIEALRLNSRYNEIWLKNSDRIDTRYYVGQAFEQAGVFKEAGDVYRETLNKLYAIKGTPLEKERNVFEVLPKIDALNLRLAVIAARQREFTKAADHLKAIQEPAKTLAEPEQIERAETSADVAEALGQTDSAKKFLGDLIATWRGQPVAVSGLHLRLAKLQAGDKDYKSAEASVTKIINLQEDTGLVPEDTHARALELKADLLLARGNRPAAVQVYKQLLDAFEGKRPLASIRYKVGKIQFEDGDVKGAETTWASLKDDKGGIWHRLATEQLENAKWKGDYKKYIDRIPAMSDAGPDASPK